MENYSTIKRIWMIMVREWRILTSRRIYLIAMVGAPLFCVVFFFSLMEKGLPENLPVAVVDMDNSNISRRLTRQLDNFKQTDVVAHCTSFHEARKLVQQGSAYGIYYIPEGLEHDILSFRQPKVSFYTNNSYIIAGSLLFRDMKTLSILGSAYVARELRYAKGQTERQAMAEIQPIAIETHPIGNPWINYAVYLCNTILPGLLCVMIVITTVFALGSEVKSRRSNELLRIAKDDILTVMIGKLLPHTLIYFLIITFIEVMLYSYMHFPCQNGLGSMLIVSYLFVLACESIAVFFYALIPILRIALSLSAFFCMLSFSISGFTFPVSEMHPILQTWATVFPLRHFFLLYVDNALNGISFCYSWGSYVALMLFMFLPLLSSWRLKTVYKYDVYDI